MNVGLLCLFQREVESGRFWVMLVIVARAWNASTKDVWASLWVWGLHGEFQGSLGRRAKACLKIKQHGTKAEMKGRDVGKSPGPVSQWIKVFATEPHNLSLVPETHVVAENRLQYAILWQPHKYGCIYKQKKKKMSKMNVGENFQLPGKWGMKRECQLNVGYSGSKSGSK